MCLAAMAQAGKDFHLSVGIEAGTTGAGIEVAVPVVANHLVVKAGFNTLPYKLETSLPVPEGIISEANSYVAKGNGALEVSGSSQRLRSIPKDAQINITATPTFNSGKIMLEFYPFFIGGLHLTAGLYFGQGSLLTADLSAPEFWDAYSYDMNLIEDSEASQYLSRLDETLIDAGISLGGKTYKLDGANAQLALGIAKVRPYFGIGFGRSIPRSHLGFQTDLGVWYHGTPYLALSGDVAEVENTDNIQAIDLDFGEILDKAVIWPQISFRLIYRIF